MSCLPTPPSTSHREKDRSREKENIFPKPCKRQRGVEWSDDTEIHLFFTSQPGELESRHTRRDSKSSQSLKAPTKGILKPARALQPYTPEAKREVTPQPDNILANSQYLVWPISTLVKDDKEVTLKDFTEAWSVLTARIRSCIEASQKEKSHEVTPLSHPILRPLQKNVEKLTGAVVRDLKRVLIDPLGDTFSYEIEKANAVDIKSEGEEADMSKLSGLPSPKDSPKKRGMSAEQIKYSRDLCVLCHSVIKFLIVAFTTPMIYNIFTPEHIHDIFTAHLNILLEPSLPTSNARKTYAIAMTLIQMQRLPSEYLAKETSRITLAIRRGLEGKLGREGKKGPGSDGLRAIHDLSLNHPVIFIPTLCHILPSILANLSSPSAPIRVTSAHALGGFAYALVSSEDLFLEDELREIQASTSKTIYDYFVGTPGQASSPISSMSLTSRSSPKYKNENDTWIVKTLKIVLATYDPPSTASSPVWGISVLSSFIILLGPLLLKDYKALRLVATLLQSALKYRKGSVRALGCRVISLLVLGWIKYDPKDAIDEDDSDMEEGKKPKSCREMYFRVIRSTLDSGNAIALLGALLGPSGATCSAWKLKRILSIVDTLTSRGGPSSGLGMEIIQHLTSLPSNTLNESEYQSFVGTLLPQSLFSVSPGLLATEWANITPAIKYALEDLPKYTDLRSMDVNEITIDWVWKGLLKCWKNSLSVLEIDDEEETPHVIMDVWQKLVNIRAQSLEGDVDGLQLFAKECACVLAEIIKDDSIDLRGSPTSNCAIEVASATDFDSTTSTQKTASKYTVKARKLSIVRDLWSVVPATFTSERCYPAIAELLGFLAENERDLVPREDIRPQGNTPHSVACIEWTRLTAAVLKCGVSTGDDIITFWNGLNIDVANDLSERKAGWEWSEEQRSLVWRAFSKSWREEDGSWEGTYAILGLPFLENHPWNMSDSDVAEWEAMLQYCIVKGLDIGLTSFYTLDIVARSIERRHLQTLSSAVRIADLLLSQIDFSEADPSTEYPEALIDVVHDILDVSYPPEAKTKMMSFWLIRSITAFIDNVDPNWLVNALDAMQNGLCAWMRDECHMFSVDEFSVNIVPLYQTILVSLQSINPNESYLKALSSIITAPFYTTTIGHAEILYAFKEFWKTNHSEISCPIQGWPEDLASVLMLADIQTNVQEASGDIDEADLFFNKVVDVDKGYDADISVSSTSSISDVSQDIDGEKILNVFGSEVESLRCSLEFETAVPLIPKFEPIPEGNFTQHNVRPSFSPITFQLEPTENNTSKLSCSSLHDFSCHADVIPSTPKASASFSPFKHVQTSSLKRKRSQNSYPKQLPATSNSSRKEKENEDPLSTQSSSPLTGKNACKSAKRVIFSDSETSPDVSLKKRKINQVNNADMIKVTFDLLEDSSSDSEDIRMVEDSLIIERTKNESIVDTYEEADSPERLPSLLGHIARAVTKQSSDSESKAGQWRFFMEAVEVPTLRQFEEARRANIHSQSPWTNASKTKRRSAKKTFRVPPVTTRSSRKLRSLNEKKDKPSTTDSPFHDTISIDDDSELQFNSDDSFFRSSDDAKVNTKPTFSEEEVETSITPQHLLTPPMRYAVRQSYKPASHDPASSSPIRARVARKLCKSFSAVTPANASFSVNLPPLPQAEKL